MNIALIKRLLVNYEKGDLENFVFLNRFFFYPISIKGFIYYIVMEFSAKTGFFLIPKRGSVIEEENERKFLLFNSLPFFIPLSFEWM